MPDPTSLYRGHRFPAEMIAHAVRLYLRFALRVRDVEELLAERGVTVSYETVRRWVAKFGPYYAEALRRRAPRRGQTWHLDEMAVRIGGQRQWLGRAVDEHGQTLDVRLQARRDTAAAERCFRRLLAGAEGAPPVRITTDKVRQLCGREGAAPGAGQRRAHARALRPRRHLRSAAAYRSTMRDRVATWRAVAGLRAA